MRLNSWLEDFGTNLKEILQEKNMTATELAEKCRLSKSSVSNYINAERVPNLKAILNMSYVLDIDLFEFIDFGDMID